VGGALGPGWALSHAYIWVFSSTHSTKIINGTTQVVIPSPRHVARHRIQNIADSIELATAQRARNSHPPV